MQSNLIRALLIDDTRMQYAMMRDFLSVSTQGTITLDWAVDYDEGLAAIRADQYDVYLVDYQLGERNGLELLKQAMAEGCKTPIILITGYSSRDIDLAAMQIGAADFLDKSEIKPSTLERSIRYATERAKIMSALRESEEVHRQLLAVTRQQARELMLLDQARTALADQLDLPEVIRTTVELVAATFGYTQVSLYLNQNDTLVLQHQVGYDRVIAEIPIDQGISGRVFRTGKPILLEDVQSDPAFLGAIEGLVSEICVPLFDHERVVGVLNVESSNDVCLTEDDLRILMALGTHVGIVIGRARLYAEVRRSEERYRAISELISDYAFSLKVNPDGTIEDEWFTYDAFTRMTGYTREEVLANGRYSYYHPDDTEAVLGQVATVLEGRLSAEEFRIITKSGEVRWLYLYRRPVWDQAQQRVVRIYGTAQDITARKQAEEARRQSEERYRIISELISDYAFAYRVEPDGALTREWVTDSYSRITGYEVGEIDSRDVYTLYAPQDQPRAAADIAAVVQGKPNYGEYQIVTKQGEERWLRVARQPVWDEQQRRVVRFLGCAQDITERKRAEAAEREQRILAEALRDTAEALNSALNFEEVVDRILDNVGHVVPHDNASLMLFEGNAARVVRSTFPGLPAGQEIRGDNLRFDLSSVMPFLAAAAKMGQAIILGDIWNSLPDDLMGWMQANNQAIWLHSYAGIPIQIEGEMIGLLNLASATPDFFTTDTAVRLQAFSHQIATAIQNARRYEQAQELATLNERQRLARDLHDAVSQTLFSASVIAETIPRLWPDMPLNVREVVTELHHLNRQALAEMRSLLLELRPRALIETSMGELLEQLVETFTQRHRIEISLDVDGHFSLPPEAQVGLYRIAQEALNNISKHAQAIHVNLSLIREGDSVELRIRDDGRGFDPGSIPANHFGIRIMRERAETMNAAIRVASQPGRGTTITTRWPAS